MTVRLCDIIEASRVPEGFFLGVRGDDKCEVSAVEFSSGKAAAHSLFFCLRGANGDGHDYAADAYSRGCRAFVCERTLELGDDAVQVTVADSREALAYMSSAFYGHAADQISVIGITGTKGKTTTAHILRAILEESGRRCAYIGTSGVIIGDRFIETANTTPESRDLQRYFRMMADAGIAYAVIEVSSQALAHHRVDGVPFAAAAFLNLYEDHIGGVEHPTFEDYRYSKSRLFSEHAPVFAVFNADDAASGYMRANCAAETATFSVKDSAADFYGCDVSPYRDDSVLGVSFVLRSPEGAEQTLPQGEKKVRLCQPGRFSVSNALCAIALANHFGVSPTDAARTLAHATAPGRCEIVPALPGRTFVIDYAHNGVSLESSLSVFREYAPSRLICVFGSVGGRTKGRRAELAHAASTLADLAVVTSDNPDFEPPEDVIRDILAAWDGPCPYIAIPDREEAIREAVRLSEPGDIVLFAGKGHETYQLICGERVPFSERSIILEECALEQSGAVSGAF